MFLEERHRELSRQVRAFGDEILAPIEFCEEGVDNLSRSILRRLGEAGLTAVALRAEAVQFASSSLVLT